MSAVRFRLPMLLPFLTVVAPVARAADGDNPWRAEGDNPWRVALFGGDSIGMRGSLTPSLNVALPNAGTLAPSLEGESGTLGLTRLDFEDIFHRKYSTGAEVSYALSPEVETFGRFSYDALTGRSQEIGVLTTQSGNVAPVNARFGDFSSWSLELGSRYYFPTGLAFQPFAGAALGMTRVHSITAEFDIPSEATVFPDVDFTREGNRFSQELETGLDVHAAPDLDVRLAIAADHVGAPHEAHDLQLADLGLATDHSADSWSFPVTVGAIYRF
jgi:hypothetical protein